MADESYAGLMSAAAPDPVGFWESLMGPAAGAMRSAGFGRIDPAVMGQDLAGAAGHLATLPQRALGSAANFEKTGQYDPAPIVESTMLLAGGASPFAVRGAAGIFGGKLAQTADHAALAKAEQMATGGASRDAIWKDTGWFKGADDKWRFEIPDKAATMKETSPGSYTAGDVIAHPEFFKAYPETRAIQTELRDPNVGSARGQYTPSDPILKGLGVEEALMAKAAPDARETLLHELQHSIQHREGFATGSNPALFKNEAMELTRASRGQEPGLRYSELDAKRARTPLTAAEQTEMEAIYRDYLDPQRIMREKYRTAPGEVEARNVQTRRDMTPAERSAAPPWTTEDAPLWQGLIKAD